MARSCMRMFLLVLLPVAVMACAQGFQGNDDDSADDDSPPRVDAPVSTQIDARVIDAPVSTQIDAPGLPIDAPGLPIDGPPTGTCTDNTQCSAGTCCFIAICVPGTPLPAPFNCLPE